MKENDLHPHQVEILYRLLEQKGMPLSRPELYGRLSFNNWIGKYLGTPRSPGKYPKSLYERGMVNVENLGGDPDDGGRNCLFFFITAKGRKAIDGKNKPNRKSMEAMTRTELRILAKKQGISTTGTKKDVIDRFMRRA